jgi:hypothetical protein
MADFEIKRDAPQGYNTVGFVYLETKCVGKCSKPYRIDECHPEYATVKMMLEAGDRSIIRCYHNSGLP